MSGGWESFRLYLAEEERAWAEERERAENPTSCPHDGVSLVQSEDGSKVVCPFGDYWARSS